VTSFLPPHLYLLHPFSTTPVSLFCCFLAPNKDHPLASLSADPSFPESHFLYATHPISKCEICGTVSTVDEGRNRFLVDDGTGSAQVELHEDFEVFDPSTKIRINAGDRVRVSGLISWGYRMLESSPKRERQVKALQLKKLPKIGGAIEMARTWSRTTELHKEVYSRSLSDVMPYFTPLPRKLVLDMGDRNGPRKSLFERLLECENNRKYARTKSSSMTKDGPTELVVNASEVMTSSSQESILFIQLVIHIKGIIERYHSDALESRANNTTTIITKALTSSAFIPSILNQKTAAEKVNPDLLRERLKMGSWIIGDTLVDDENGDQFEETVANNLLSKEKSPLENLLSKEKSPLENLLSKEKSPLENLLSKEKSPLDSKQTLPFVKETENSLPMNFTSQDISAILQADHADFVRSLIDAQDAQHSLQGDLFLENISQSGLVSLANDGYITSNDGNKSFIFLSIEKVIAPAMMKALRHLFEQWRLDKEAEESLKSDIRMGGQNIEEDSTLVDEIIDVGSILHGLRPRRKFRQETSELPVFSHSLVIETSIALGFLSHTVTAPACKKAATYLETTHQLRVVNDFEYRLMTEEDMLDEIEMEEKEEENDEDLETEGEDEATLEETLVDEIDYDP
jgi:hypothetical protein